MILRRQLKIIFSNTPQIVAFLLLSVACFYTVFFFIQLLYLRDSIPKANYEYHLLVALFSLFTNFPFLIFILTRPHWIQSKFIRLLTLISVLAPAVAGQAVYKEPEISRLATIVAMGLGTMFLYDPITENRFAIISYILAVFINLTIAHPLHKAIAYLDSTPLTHGPVNEIVFKLSNAFIIAYIIREYNKICTSQKNLLDSQAHQLSEIEQLKDEAEKARMRAEARLTEIEVLRNKEMEMTRRLALSARYEALMREQYGGKLSTFLRALMEALQKDLGYIAGLAYRLEGDGGRVEAVFGLPDYMGQTFQGGLIETAARLRSPYLVQLSEESFLTIQTALVALRPRWVLYLPLYTDISDAKPVALLELLFTEPPSSEVLEAISPLLPRLGNYLWMQLSPEINTDL
jgi:hypothetical protein